MTETSTFTALKISPERYEIETSAPYNIRRCKDTSGNDIPAEKRKNIKKTKQKMKEKFIYLISVMVII